MYSYLIKFVDGSIKRITADRFLIDKGIIRFYNVVDDEENSVGFLAMQKNVLWLEAISNEN